MTDNETIIAGIVIPSDSPFFLTVVGLHVLVALVCVIAGIIAMLSNKRPGQHPTFGTIRNNLLLVLIRGLRIGDCPVCDTLG